MSRPSPIPEEFWPLLNAACDDALSEPQISDLENILDADPAARNVFLDHFLLETDLQLLARAKRACHTGLSGIQATFAEETAPALSCPTTAAPVFASPVHTASVSGVYFTGWPAAYLVASVIFAIGLVIGAMTHVSEPAQVAALHDGSSTSGAPHASPPSKPVGRITGVANCVWPNAFPRPCDGDSVFQGCRYALQSGLMEITYDTGARVILQGPATYEVDANNGGFLRTGRLTGKVEAVAAKGFSVRTPTASVIDLGTEFGVSVSRTGVTEAQVFVGKVKVVSQRSAAGAQKSVANAPSEETLVAGQAAMVTVGAIVRQGSPHEAAQPYVRRMPVSARLDDKAMIDRLDYSETWSCNSPTRAGSHLDLLTDEALLVERCHGNPTRLWVISSLAAATTWPYIYTPEQWPGFQIEGPRSGMLECGLGDCYFGFEYGLRDDFVVQFDAVQAVNRVNITIGDKPATIGSEHALSVFFRQPGTTMPEIGVYTPSKLEADTGLRSGIPRPFEWHNYAVRFNLRDKQLGIWVDRQYRGTVNLADVVQGMEQGKSWASLPWTNRYVGAGVCTDGRVWSDSFRVGAPGEAALSPPVATPLVPSKVAPQPTNPSSNQPSSLHKEN